MRKYHLIIFLAFTSSILLCNNSFGQEKRVFLQNRFDGYTEIITKDYTVEKLNKLKDNLKSVGILFTFSNVNFNNKKEIISISIHVKNKKSNAQITVNDDKKPIPDILVGEINGIATTSLKFPKKLDFKNWKKD